MFKAIRNAWENLWGGTASMDSPELGVARIPRTPTDILYEPATIDAVERAGLAAQRAEEASWNNNPDAPKTAFQKALALHEAYNAAERQVHEQVAAQHIGSESPSTPASSREPVLERGDEGPPVLEGAEFRQEAPAGMPPEQIEQARATAWRETCRPFASRDEPDAWHPPDNPRPTRSVSMEMYLKTLAEHPYHAEPDAPAGPNDETALEASLLANLDDETEAAAIKAELAARDQVPEQLAGLNYTPHGLEGPLPAGLTARIVDDEHNVPHPQAAGFQVLLVDRDDTIVASEVFNRFDDATQYAREGAPMDPRHNALFAEAKTAASEGPNDAALHNERPDRFHQKRTRGHETPFDRGR